MSRTLKIPEEKDRMATFIGYIVIERDERDNWAVKIEKRLGRFLQVDNNRIIWQCLPSGEEFELTELIWWEKM